MCAKKKTSPPDVAVQASPAVADPHEDQTTTASQPLPIFPVIGIGASAGGLAAIIALLEGLPEKTDMALILAQHRAPTAKGDILVPLLQKNTTLEVVEITDGTTLEPNRLFVPPAGHLMGVFNGKLQLFKEELHKRERLPIDFFFRSLAEDLHERAAAVVLSGADTDGSLGVKAIKEHGGMVMVQDPASAEFNTMPASAVATGMADFILPPKDMAGELTRYLHRAAIVPVLKMETKGDHPSSGLEKILLVLRTMTGNDFSPYKHSTILRRIKRRMDVQQIDRMHDYANYLKTNDEEVRALFRDLLIGVTSFFRDPEAFQTLKQVLRDYLTAQPLMKKVVRLWTPGCSTGEEAYSLAITVREAMQDVGKIFAIQIYATDLNDLAIEVARQGLYPLNIAADVPPKTLERYFSRSDAGYRIKKEIRETVVFAVQNVLQDPPFSRLDIVCCRNLLIYLNQDAQKKALTYFHYALQDGGLLLLGTSESIGLVGDLFDERDRRWRIYARRPTMKAPLFFPNTSRLRSVQAKDNTDHALAVADPDRQVLDPCAISEHFLLEHCVPVSVLISQSGEILHIHGRTGPYLELPPGRPAHNIISMAREGLKTELAAAIGMAAAQKKDVELRHVRMQTAAKGIGVAVAVRYVMSDASGRVLLLVTFSDVPAPKRGRRSTSQPLEGGEDPRIQEQDRELQHLRESMQSVVEEYETSSEEFKSTNEELQSANEELQSTNEEIETAKEELQSINEEQIMLNSELQSKIEELSHVNNDLANLLSGTHIATLFLDMQLNVKRFTPAIKTIMHLISVDIGRPISHIASNLEYGGMMEDARQVLDTLQSTSREVRTKDGAWYLMRILPYRTLENVINGLVLTFGDITAVKRSEALARKAQNLAEGVISTIREPLLGLDAGYIVTMANPSFYHMFAVTPEVTLGRSLFSLADGRWDLPKLHTLLEGLGQDKEDVEDFKMDFTPPGKTPVPMLLNVRLIRDQHDGTVSILLAFSLAVEA